VIRTALVVTSAALLSGFSGAVPPHTHLATVSDTSANFSWTGSLPSGGWLRIRNLAGNVEVRRGTGSTIEIRATPEPESNNWLWENGRIEPVKFVTQRQGSDVIVCAISEDMPRCDPNDLSQNNGWNNDSRPQAMHVVVQIPAGASIQAGTMHGDLEIADVSADVIARSGHGGISIRNVTGPVTASSGHGDVSITNAAARVTANTGHGNIHVSSAGAVHATTGHGDVVVELASAAATGANDMTFETGHGNVRVVAPRTLSGDVDLHTGRGRVSSDFPLSSTEPNRDTRSGSAHGILGSGGRSVRLSSGHGDVSLTTGG
jgi:hypothetical protein